ncbi:MAG: D-alanyl-D-alanine carboxypeptidase [Actinomycetota bacterium]|nr:D-alanyl-D-alanine carboxypeptidase [Actinomycetota bacterium]
MGRAGIAILLSVVLAGCTTTQSAEPPTNKSGGGRDRRHQVARRHKPRREKKRVTVKPTPAIPPRSPRWAQRLDNLIGSSPMGVEVALGGETIYKHRSANSRVPASVQKLPLTMALLDRFGPRRRFQTIAATRKRKGGVVPGNLWVIGEGDPTVTGKTSYSSAFAFDATELSDLATRIKKAGITEIEGRVIASTRPFARDWFARGWKDYFPSSQVGLPTALTFNGNVYKGHYTPRPERLLAESLTRRLKKEGIAVGGSPGAGRNPERLRKIAAVHSEPLWRIVRFMNRQSSNFFAEVLGKRLAYERYGERNATISGAAKAIDSYAMRREIAMESQDCSGLSYENRISPRELVDLLFDTSGRPWGLAVRRSLPSGGQGTLTDRLRDVRIRAKTGTLLEVSSIAGWIWVERAKAWAEFAILSRGLDKSSAMRIEDAVLRTVNRWAR